MEPVEIFVTGPVTCQFDPPVDRRDYQFLTGRIIQYLNLLHCQTGKTTVKRPAYMYTANHEKRGSLFLTITLANLNRFL